MSEAQDPDGLSALPGLDAGWRALLRERGARAEQVARVVGELRGCYWVRSLRGEEPAELSGNLRQAIRSGSAERPAVGDFVLLRTDVDEAERRPIEEVLPRRTRIARKEAGRRVREQVVAANVDVVFLVCALGRDVNPRRIERLATIVWAGGAVPVLVLTKADTCADPEPHVARARLAAPGAELHVVSAVDGTGLAPLAAYLGSGRTVALLGTSGAGKSTLVNLWFGGAPQRTGAVGADGKGRHTTRSRQLLCLPGGAALIDTPGLRQVGLAGSEAGLTHAFDDVVRLAETCRFADCRHGTEPDCAVRAAVAAGEVPLGRVEAFVRLTAEQAAQAQAMEQRQRRAPGASGSRPPRHGSGRRGHR
ncbi:MAG: ribosome small subunit-dependent GTPase A [Deltaproteobacteria bacterium]|nr:ribosome small subunit-dependent GTPase A [Deltaproteobacteria bacterium]